MKLYDSFKIITHFYILSSLNELYVSGPSDCVLWQHQGTVYEFINFSFIQMESLHLQWDCPVCIWPTTLSSFSSCNSFPAFRLPNACDSYSISFLSLHCLMCPFLGLSALSISHNLSSFPRLLPLCLSISFSISFPFIHLNSFCIHRPYLLILHFEFQSTDLFRGFAPSDVSPRAISAIQQL